jgi:hypothetical protein
MARQFARIQMTLTIRKVSDDLYTASATPPDVREEWSTNEPLTREQLTGELTARGAHQIDVADVIFEQEPLGVQLTAERYFSWRKLQLKYHAPSLMNEPVEMVLMDWNGWNGTASVHAFADGTASIYFSTGGGLRGGSKKYPAIRQAALSAVQFAKDNLHLFEPIAAATELPSGEAVFFYLNTQSGGRRAISTQTSLEARTDPLNQLGVAMRQIISEYQLNFPYGQPE